MKSIFVSNWMTLDGIFSGLNGDTDWFTSDNALYEYNMQQLLQADTLIFGRTTYELMLSYWPTSQARSDFPLAFEYMNECKKHIFSKTITTSTWAPCYFHREINAAIIEDIKAAANKKIVILGSGEVAAQLHNLGLVDEYHILLDPQIRQVGKRFFREEKPVSLHLEETRRFGCGVTYLRYSVVK